MEMAGSSAPLRCDNCGEPRDGTGIPFPEFCTLCNEIAAATHKRKVHTRDARRMARETTEPRGCPYCFSHHTGDGLVQHLRDVHHASMVLARDAGTGRLEVWPPRADQ